MVLRSTLEQLLLRMNLVELSASLPLINRYLYAVTLNIHTAVRGFMLQALCAVAKSKAMYALLPRYCAYLTLGEGTCLMNEYMSEQMYCCKA
jgi:hypothetical protein